jgi:hypothetical protein
LYSNAAGNRDLIRNSGFTTLVIWTIHVQTDGSLVLNDQPIISNGAYVGRAGWPAEVAAFKSGTTSISRIEVGLSSHNDSTFLNIRDLVFSQGTGTNGILYKNFQALKKAVPVIDGINYDEESHIYDQNVLYTMEQFSLMLADLGFHLELDVFCCSEAWISVFNAVNGPKPGTIDRIDLQCYAGGGGNDPCAWNGSFGGLQVTSGLWAYPSTESGGYWSKTPSQVQSQMSAWNSSCNLAGGFMWYLDDMLLATNQYAVADYATAINTALGIAPSRKIGAIVCGNTDYYGWGVEVGRGPSGALEISAAGGQIDQISSLKVMPGWKVTLYSEANFTGSALVKTADDSTLVDDGWNDRTKSLTVLPVQEKPVTLYQNTDSWGWSAGFDAGNYTAGQIVAAGGQDNDASSVTIAPGYRVTFYDLDNFQGPTLVKTADDVSFVDDGWNDIVSSMKVSLDLTQWKPVTLYQDAAFSGWAAGFRAGAYTLNQLVAAGGKNDDVTSVAVAPGYSVKLYWDNNFQGATLVKTNDDVCLFDDGWNDQVSSFIVYAPTNAVAPVNFIAPGAVWKYFDKTNDLGTAWRSSASSDATWSSGMARLGYGGDGEVTQVGSNRQWTTCFRRQFYVGSPALVSNLTARLTRDDAAVIYLNGTEIWRDTNLPSGGIVISNQTPALSTIDGTSETSWLSLDLAPSALKLLVPGWNLLAAEVHNRSLSSSDLGFDFELAATEFVTAQPPLQLSASGTNLSFSWPDRANTFGLYSAATMPATGWASVTNQPTFVNGAWSVSLPTPATGSRFFRLQSQ